MKKTPEGHAIWPDGEGLSTSFAILLFALAAYSALALVEPRMPWARMQEYANIAASIATGDGFSSPYPQATGPSALEPPIFAYVLAGIFRIFGVLSLASYRVAVALNVVVHALSCVVLFWVGTLTFDRRRGLYAALALAILPLLASPIERYLPAGYLFIPANLIWNLHLTELAILVLVWLTLRDVHWAVYGVFWGFSALLDPTVLALLPALWTWRMRQRLDWRGLGLAAATMVLLLLPWLARNYIVFHRPVFIRDGFGVELRVGNIPGRKGLWSPEAHPAVNMDERKRFVELGELKYADACEQEALRVIRARPWEFVANTLRRMGYFWIGPPVTTNHLPRLRYLRNVPGLTFCLLTLCGTIRALRAGNRIAQLLASIFVFYPLVYYITHTANALGYQYPIQPEMILFATSAVVYLASKLNIHVPEQVRFD